MDAEVGVVDGEGRGPRAERAAAGADALGPALVEALVEALFTQSPFSVGLYDAAGRVVTGNPAYERHWGIRLADVPPDYSLLDDPQLAASGVLDLIRRTYAGEHVVLPPVRYDAAQAAGVGRTVWTQGHCTPVRDASGVVTHVAIVHEDVTERVESQRALAASEARFRDFLEHAPDAVFVADVDGRFTDVNLGACRMLGYPREALVGMTIADIIPEGDVPRLAAARERLLGAGGSAEVSEWTLRRADGSVVPVEISTKIYADGRWQAIVRDISERRRAAADRERLFDAERAARAAAEEARRAAEGANKAKGDFLAVMSHELRTPLNAIGGYAELMELGIHGPVTPEQTEALARIQRSQQHLLGLINDVLNFVKLETGHVRYDLATVPLRPALERVEEFVGPQLRAKGLCYELRATPDADLGVRADAEKLRQILLNLLSNAIKFTDAGGTIRVACERDGGMARVRVSDTGVGIPADRLEHVFEPFVQVGRHLNRPSEGVGLGLAISRDLARGMGGDLVAESRIGVGSVFTLTLPVA